ncbi:uncharacterized protein C14orf93-like [Hemibagrus wyckioides]|uniref:uncharacterized protein C14orf93-like n=1 Tax=Hemibagrus wyckioides TaxID=337641 RepID=UPI00266CA16C|nr:uncharacterized protein C14orf93-like [Hemibagrus wyckioides]
MKAWIKMTNVVACKTYYETVRINFRSSQPELANVAAANKTSARSHQRRKRLLEARQSVLAVDEVDFWRGITADMMSDEEDGAVDGVSGWIVRPPSFRSQEFSNLCAKLQMRLEANALNSFYAQFEARYYVTVRKNIPPSEDQVLCLTTADMRKPMESSWTSSIPGRVLRDCAEQLADVFTDIFSISLSNTIVPMCLKSTSIIPLPNKSPNSKQQTAL